MLPLICLTADSNHRQFPNGPRQLICPKTYSNAIAAAGGLPLLAAEACPEIIASLCHALVLTGGDDPNPALFDQSPLNDSVSVDRERDTFEIALIRVFLAQNKPILAICRGCQILNCALGGDLYQDLPSQLGLYHRDSALLHPIACTPHSTLAQLYGPTFSVNSLHHQAIRRIAPGLTVTARAADGVIEAFESTHPDQLLWGVQFHPEKLSGPLWDGRTPDFASFFRAFIQAVRHHSTAKSTLL